MGCGDEVIEEPTSMAIMGATWRVRMFFKQLIQKKGHALVVYHIIQENSTKSENGMNLEHPAYSNRWPWWWNDQIPMKWVVSVKKCRTHHLARDLAERLSLLVGRKCQKWSHVNTNPAEVSWTSHGYPGQQENAGRSFMWTCLLSNTWSYASFIAQNPWGMWKEFWITMACYLT